MKLIIQKTDNFKEVNKIIEIESTEIDNNDTSYFIKTNETPIVKYTDTDETFLINNIQESLKQYEGSEILLTIQESDLISFSGSGTTPDLTGYATETWVLENTPQGDYIGAIVPTSTPTGSGANYWNATQAGTYTNFGGVVVAANSFAFISRSATGVFSISQTALDLTSYQTKIDAINSDSFVNVTKEFPLTVGLYHNTYSAIRTITTDRKKKGLIITYEIAVEVWETIIFLGEIAAWTDETKWITINSVNIYGLSRSAIDKKYWRKGLLATFTDVSTGLVKIEQYIGVDRPTTTQFNLDSNWIRLASYDDISLVYTNISTETAKIDSLRNSFLNDVSTIKFVNKSYTAATGVLASTTDLTKLTTEYLLPIRDIESLKCGVGYSFIITELDANKAVLASTGWLNSKTSFNVNTRFIRFMLRIDAGGSLPPSAISSTGCVLITKLKSPSQFKYLADRVAVNPLRNATVVNNWQAEKMAHASTLVEDTFTIEGDMWAAHYASETGYTESIANNNAFCTLLKLNPCDFGKVERFKALSPNELVGTWQQGVTSPYDPTLIVNSTNIQFLMLGQNTNDAFGVRYCQRIFDKTTKTFGSTITNLNIRYTFSGTTYTEVLNKANCELMVERLQSRTGVSFGLYPIFSGRIQKANGYFWVYLGSLTQDDTGFQGCILKSTDGITWDVVAFPPLSYFNVWEGALSIIGTNIYVFIKADNRYRTYKYIESTNTWFEGPELNGQILSRPFLYYDAFKNKLYSIYNSPQVNNSWGSVYRSGVTFSVLDQNTLEILDSQSFTQDTACHYFSIIDFKGTKYFMFTEDRKKYNINSMKGQISIIPFDFLNI